ncbi:hypothetical protein ACFFGF_02005 [Asaia lannensis]|uniref:Secreted protein n=1 Tax=Asaia lannensis NBRC 102526 TaxID=1307926 RepID=A0ABT1CD56_9PROT|nr:hypothetical protein [Asaia lannensis]MCO6158794.1 hypothetical protein [Asaia lannensis NBRC 102526]GBR00206.1 hypothetical protein AA102526_2084 [Asaia lannensis NBRC 102526]
MRRMPALAVFTISLLCQGVSCALATPERPVEQQGRHLDFDSRAPLRCTHAPHLVHTAYTPGEKPVSGPVSLRSCFSDTDRIGAGYTQFVRNSAVRHLHHRMKG